MSNSQNPSQSENTGYSASSYDPNTYYNYYQAQYSQQNYQPADYSHTANPDNSSYSQDSQKQYTSNYDQHSNYQSHSYESSRGYDQDKSEDSSRGSYQGRGRGRGGFRGGRGGGHHDHSRDSQPAPVDTIYVSGLPSTITEDDLAERFGSIGVIKTDKKTRMLKIYIYKDKETGIPKGDATVTYDDPQTCSAAIEWFDGKEFKGATLHIELAQQRDSFKGKGGRGGGGAFNNSNAGKGGDWNCASCGNLNWGWRSSCNKCSAPKPADAGGSASDDSHSRGSSQGSKPSFGMKDGDWVCSNPSCAAVNFARRSNCHKCNAPKSGGSSGGSRDSRDDRRPRDSRDDRDRDRDSRDSRDDRDSRDNRDSRYRDRQDDRRDSGRDRISDDRRDRRDRPY